MVFGEVNSILEFATRIYQLLDILPIPYIIIIELGGKKFVKYLLLKVLYL